VREGSKQGVRRSGGQDKRMGDQQGVGSGKNAEGDSEQEEEEEQESSEGGGDSNAQGGKARVGQEGQQERQRWELAQGDSTRWGAQQRIESRGEGGIPHGNHTYSADPIYSRSPAHLHPGGASSG